MIQFSYRPRGQRSFIYSIPSYRGLLLAWVLVAAMVGSAWAQPTITSINPIFGPPGSILTVSGTNLLTVDECSIGGINGIILSRSATELRVLVIQPTTGLGSVIVRRLSPAQADTAADPFSIIPNQQASAIESPLGLVDAMGTGAFQGESVALSADGNTALVGGSRTNGDAGAAWVYVRSGCNWTLQQKLTATGLSGLPRLGKAVALSADGNRAAVSAPEANSGNGAVVIFERSGSVWNQTETIIPADLTPGVSRVGGSLALSADGSTLVFGSTTHAGGAGGFWVYRFIGGTWVALPVSGSPGVFRRIGSGVLGAAQAGAAVAISANASTIAVGAPQNDNGDGVVWVFALNTGGTDYVEQIRVTAGGAGGQQRAFGSSVSLSSRGNNLAVGSPNDNLLIGRVYVYVRTFPSGIPTWANDAQAINPTGANGAVLFGSSVSITADGNQIAIGGPNQNIAGETNYGQAWLYSRVGTTWNFLSSFAPNRVSNGVGESVNPDIGATLAQSANGTTLLVGGPRANATTGGAWVYSLPAPSLSSISPTAALGGTTVSINGNNLRDIQSVSIGGTAAQFRLSSPTTLRVVVPTGVVSTGAVVSVTDACGTNSLGPVFTFFQQPVIDSIRPNRVGAGFKVRIHGQNLLSTTSVSLGGIPITLLPDSITNTRVVGIVRNGATGNVQLTTVGGSATLTNGFTFLGTPRIASYSPPEAFPGETITINGANFLPGETQVWFGGVQSGSVAVGGGGNSLTAVLGSGASGNVVVRTLGGSDTLGGFIQKIPIPEISSFSPTTAGVGMTVTIRGNFLNLTPTVTIGGAAATGVTVISPTQLTAVVGNGATSGNVCVTTAGGTICRGGFSIIPRPVISSFTPSSGQQLDSVTISGSFFKGASQVTIGGTPVAWFRVINDGQIKARVGAGTTGSIVVTTAGNTGSSMSAFTFISDACALGSVSPSVAVARQRVILTGTNIGLPTSVEFGTAGSGFLPAVSFRALSSTQVEAMLPQAVEIGSIEVRLTVTRPVVGTTHTFSLPITTTTAAPIITGFSSTHIGLNSTLFILGQNLGDASSVTLGFSGSPSSYTPITVSNDSLKVIVGTGASGTVEVCTPSGCTTSVSSLTYSAPPTIGSFTPAGCTNNGVFINGTNFFDRTNTKVFLGGHPVRSINQGLSTNTLLVVTVDTCCTGPITVQAPHGTATSAPSNFSYSPCTPTISSISPTSGTPGTWVTITGTNLQQITSVRFGGQAAPLNSNTFEYITTSTQFRVRVPSNGVDGFIAVDNPANTAASAQLFDWVKPVPVVTQVIPDSARIGETVRLIGNFLHEVTQVRLGGVLATVTHVDSFRVDAVVLPGTNGGLVCTYSPVEICGPSLTIRPSPGIDNFLPAVGHPFSSFTVSGFNFNNLINVTIGNSIATDYTRLNANTIQASVQLPAQRPVGGTLLENVIVQARNGTASRGTFQFVFPAPVITSFSPSTVKQGDIVTITGSGLYPPDLVSVAGVPCTDITTNAPLYTQVTARVGQPVLDTSLVGKVKVLVVGDTAISAGNISFVPAPRLETVEPSIASVASGLTVRGRNIVNIGTVTIGSFTVPPANVSFAPDGKLMSIALAEGMPTGLQTLQVGNISSTSSIPIFFVPPPSISGFGPVPSGGVIPGRDTLLITGQNLGWVDEVNCQECELTLNGFRVSQYTVINDQTIKVGVPQQILPGTGTISIRTQGGLANSSESLSVAASFTLESDDLNRQLEVFPTLVTDKLSIRGRVVPSSDPVGFTIYSLVGAQVVGRTDPPARTTGELNTEFDMTSLPPGAYMLVISIGRTTGRWLVLKV